LKTGSTMPEPEPPQQYVSFSRAHLEQRDQFYPEDETEEDGDAWSKVGLTSQTDEHQDDTSTRRKVAARTLAKASISLLAFN
jgi:hypothetical protein